MKQEAAQLEAAAVEAGEAANPMALVRVQNAIVHLAVRAKQVEDWTKQNLKLRSGGGSRARFDSGARNAGRQAGHSVRMKPSAGYVTA